MPTAAGFTLIELVMTITVMTILTLGVMPLVKVSVKRQKEQQLRDALRQMRIGDRRVSSRYGGDDLHWKCDTGARQQRRSNHSCSIRAAKL